MREIPLLNKLPSDWKLRAKRHAPDWLITKARPNTIRTSTSSGTPRGRGIPIYALVCTWNEEDIIHASVTNASKLGADQVFLIDNGSSDETISEAVEAGAHHVMTFITESFDERYKYRLINEVVGQISNSSDHDQIWWLMMDADEFNAVPGGGRLPEFLEGVDESCRVVGARVFDHYPTPGVRYDRRTNPLDVQPMYREKIDHRCELGHHKHPLFLWGRNRPRIEIEPGFHQLACSGEALYEPAHSLLLHHFPFRNEDDARRRLEKLADRGLAEEPNGPELHAHLKARSQSLDAVYAGRHDLVLDYRTGKPGVELIDWRDVAEERFEATDHRP